MTNPSLNNFAGYQELLEYIGRSVASTLQIVVQNNSGGTILAGSPVYISGSNGTFPLVLKAKADSITTMPDIGITVNDIPDGETDFVQFSGFLNLDTSAFTTGDQLYVSAATAGTLTHTEPAAPNLSRRVALVVLASATGVLFLYPDTDVRGEGIGASTGTSLALSGGLGINGKAVQTPFAAGAALIAYSAGANGLATGAAMQALVAKVQAIDTALLNIGITST